MKQKNILIIGYGDVGGALAKAERDAGNIVEINDKIRDNNAKNGHKFDIAHICYPYYDKFIPDTIKHILFYTADLYIIHSTIQVGTTDKLISATHKPIIHSPVRGCHGEIFIGLKTFVKYIGGEDKLSKSAANHLESIGIKTEILISSKTAELLKLLSTAYYGWNILFAKEAQEFCKLHDLNFKDVYTNANQTYNEGYKILKMDHVIRPILAPPEGKIGGTCVSQNIELLDDLLLKFIFKELNI